MAYSAKISVEDGEPVVRLADDAAGVEAVIVPAFGNRTIRMLVDGQNILHFPFERISDAKADRSLNGIPFLAPWANRMDGGGFRAGGREFRFHDTAGTLRMDANGLPIHGMLSSSPLWQLAGIGSDETSAHATSRLEFWKQPALMANWPFAHSYEMTHRLAGGTLEITTAILNRSAEKMPVAIGFHPYFRIPGVGRDELSVHLPVSKHVETDARLIPTGEFRDVSFPASLPLKGQQFDDGFVALEPSPAFRLAGGGREIEVGFGPKYRVAVVYAPPGKDFVCFEPMTAVTNGVNLAAAGRYPDLEWIEPGTEWRESFRISARGWQPPLLPAARG
ncbi:MAG TPA: aldose 1-epimerase [Bryobacteraceae bacterium]|nr:aldose 1-epimerase [Bryobacteraceae bacterium]